MSVGTVSGEPDCLVERAAQAGLRAAEEVLEKHGASLEIAFLTLHVSGQPDGEPSATSSGGGNQVDEDIKKSAHQLLGLLLESAAEVAHTLGVYLQLVPRPIPPPRKPRVES